MKKWILIQYILDRGFIPRDVHSLIFDFIITPSKKEVMRTFDIVLFHLVSFKELSFPRTLNTSDPIITHILTLSAMRKELMRALRVHDLTTAFGVVVDSQNTASVEFLQSFIT